MYFPNQFGMLRPNLAGLRPPNLCNSGIAYMPVAGKIQYALYAVISLSTIVNLRSTASRGQA